MPIGPPTPSPPFQPKYSPVMTTPTPNAHTWATQEPVSRPLAELKEVDAGVGSARPGDQAHRSVPARPGADRLLPGSRPLRRPRGGARPGAADGSGSPDGPGGPGPRHASGRS